MSSDSSTLDISLFRLLCAEYGDRLPLLRCTKSTLVHLSHTLEDLVLSQQLPALLFTGFQESSHWREETERYRALATVAQQVCIFAGGQLPPESSARELHVTLRGDDPLRQEWFLVLLCSQFAVLLCGQDTLAPAADEATRQFDTLWTFDPTLVNRVLDRLEEVIAYYRPERLDSLRVARRQYPPPAPDPVIVTRLTAEMIRFEEQLHQSLYRTRAALEEQLRWRDDLTGTLVHDMRTPLQGLIMAIDLVRGHARDDAETIDHVLTVAKRSAENLNQLVQLILDTNSLATGRLQVAWQPIQPALLLAAALAPVQPVIESRQQQVDVIIDAEVPILWGDVQLLQRVIQNLVGNASKFTTVGGQIVLGVDRAPANSAVELRVRDSGMGIAPDALPHIFERYYQARAGESTGTGNGIGLYFCRLAAEAHGGSIRAVSELGNGTSITVTLPLQPPTGV